MLPAFLIVMPINSYDKIIQDAETTAEGYGLASPSGSSWFDGTFLEKWFTPGRVQQREFGQQVALEKLQYEQSIDYNRKMDEMMKAGINPNIAAAGIAGAGSTQSAPSAPSTPDGIQPSDVVGAVNAVTGGAASLASAAFQRGTMEATIENLSASAFNSLKQGGLAEWNARSIEQQLPLITDNLRAEYFLKLATIDKTWQEYKNLEQEHFNIIARYDEIIANKNVLYSIAEVNEATKLKIDEETRWIKEDNDFWEAKGYRRGDPIDVSIRDVKANGGDPSFIGDVISEYNYNVTYAKNNADADIAYTKAYNEALGKTAADWFSRPNSIPAMLYDFARRFANDINKGNKSHEQANAELKKVVEFRNAYKKFKADQKAECDRLEKTYRQFKRGGNPQAVAEAQRKWHRALERYHDFDEDDFADLLLGSYTGQ